MKQPMDHQNEAPSSVETALEISFCKYEPVKIISSPDNSVVLASLSNNNKKEREFGGPAATTT